MMLLRKLWRFIRSLFKNEFMARIKIPLSGVSTHSNHKDGACKSVVNMRPENGIWHPVAPRKVETVLSDTYDIAFVHRGDGFANWIGVHGGSVYTNIKGSRNLMVILPENVNSVQQIGNTLSFVTNSDIYYALYINSSYTYLGAMPDIPTVKFSTPAEIVGSRTYRAEYGSAPSRNSDEIGKLVELTSGLVKTITRIHKEWFYDAFIIRWAFRLYDGSLIKYSSPILIMSHDNYETWGTAFLPFQPGDEFYGSESDVRIKLFKLEAIYDFSALSNWSDIIKSVDFFVTPYIGLASPENVKKGFWHVGSNNMHNIYYPNFRGTENSIDSATEKVVNSYLFYHLFSESNFNGQKMVVFPNTDTTVKYDFSNIINQERLPVGSLSNHRYGASNASVYNSRLRLMRVRTILYGGMPIDNYHWSYRFNGVAAPSPATPKQITMVVHIRTNEGTKYVKSTGNVGNIYLNPYISYPDPRAFKIEFVTHNPDDPNFPTTLVHSIPLSLHPHLNIAYYLNEALSPITFPPQSHTIPPFVPPAGVTYHNTIVEDNKIKISEINNPFVFPSENTYVVGFGMILAESSIVMNVTDRNFGIYPVLVFTTEGVFIMSGQTADEVHRSISAPTYMEPPTSGVVCATPYGVAFITKRGLMLINQYKTEFLSPQLREDDKVINLDLTGIDSAEVLFPGESFVEYLDGVDMMLYNPYRDELIIVDRDKAYNYVYNFAAKSFYLSTEGISVIVQNIYPEIFVIDASGSLKDYKESDGKATRVAVVTRPIEFGTTDLKKLERVFLRALMRNVNNGYTEVSGKMIVAVFRSMDGVNFTPIRGLLLSKNGNYKDFDLGLFARTKFRQYVFMLVGTMDENSEVQHIEFEVDKEYKNEKMR